MGVATRRCAVFSFFHVCGCSVDTGWVLVLVLVLGRPNLAIGAVETIQERFVSNGSLVVGERHILLVL